MHKLTKYYVLNLNDQLNPVFHGTTKQVCKFLKKQVKESRLQLAVKHQRVFEVNGSKCIVVEDFEYNSEKKGTEPEEVWQLFQEGEYNLYYVSDEGRVMYKRKSTGKESMAKISLDSHGVAVVRVQGKPVQVKNLVAKYFIPEYEKTRYPQVFVKDDNPYNCAVSNLRLSSASEERQKEKKGRGRIKCALWENGKKVKTYNSIREASRDLYYGYGDISHYFKDSKHKRYKSLPFDLRVVGGRKKSGERC